MLNTKTKFHILSLLLISSYYIFSYLFFGSILINPHDNLESRVVTDHIISKMYSGEFYAYKIFLGGEFKWYYLYRIFFPENLFFFILDAKQFYFFEEISEKLISYFSFYLLGKFLFRNKINSIFGALLYTILVNDVSNPPATIFLPILPYLFYILISKNEIKIKYFIIFFLVGLNSSVVFDYPPLCIIFLLSYFFRDKKNLKIQLYFFVIISIALVISGIPILVTLLGEAIHRTERLNESFSKIITTELNSLFYSFIPNSIYFYKFPIAILKLFIVVLAFFSQNNKLRITLLIIFITFFLKVIFSSNYFQIPTDKFYSFLQGFNFARVYLSLKLLFSILLLGVLNFYLKQRTFLIMLLIFSSISFQIYFPMLEFTKEFLRKNFTEENFLLIKQEYKTKKINFKKIISIIKDKNNYRDEKISFDLNTKNSFNSYFKYELYKKIKLRVGLDRVASIGINPMIAVMNDINVIDGYHEIYPLSYKYKFRKIIADELEINEELKNYYDNWGNRVYLFYNDKNNLMLNFKEAKKIGAKYIISSFSINHKDLKFDNMYSDYNNNLYLYKINY